MKFLRALPCLALVGLVVAESPAESRYASLWNPSVGPFWPGLPEAGWNQPDSLPRPVLDVSSPAYRYPGRAMLMSLLLPGSGQLYARRPAKTIAFLGLEALALAAWDRNRWRGFNAIDGYRQFADSSWDFRRWVLDAELKRRWIELGVGIEGTHQLEFAVYALDGDGTPVIFGNTNDISAEELVAYLTNLDYQVVVSKSREYYENIGKYNQFFSGWDDAASSDTVEVRVSGDILLSPHKGHYTRMRTRANNFQNFATYAISALLLNHVVSAVDAILSTYQWNSRHAVRVGGRLRYDPHQEFGRGFIELTLEW